MIAYLSLVLGELVPKRLAIQRNTQFAYAVAPVLNGFARLMRPVIWLLSVSTNALVRLLGGDPNKTGEELTDEELRDIVSGHQGLPEDERRLLDDIFTLRGRQVSEVMRPRPEVVALESETAVSDAVSRVQELPHSRYPVVDQSIDDITGFVHVRDLYENAIDAGARPVREIARPILYVPSTARVLPTLTLMRGQGQQIAVVVDEYGGTDGIVTLEDLIEEVVGEIFDEYDTDAGPDVVPGAGGTVDGRLNLQDFHDLTGIRLPRGSSDTVGGFVIERLGRLARIGDRVEVDGHVITVTALDRRRIAQVSVVPEEPNTDGESGGTSSNDRSV